MKEHQAHITKKNIIDHFENKISRKKLKCGAYSCTLTKMPCVDDLMKQINWPSCAAT